MQPNATSASRNKLVTPQEAVRLIRSGDTLATGGFVGIGFAEELAIALQQRFEESQEPRDLTLVYAAGQGDGKGKGVDHLGREGLVKRVIGGHWGLVPSLQKLALDNKIEAYNLPQGCIAHLFRDIAAGKPGTLTSIGIGTFVDPRQQGGKINSCTTEDLVQLMNIDGRDYLFYRAFPINVAFLRGTTADLDGNVTMEKEALTLEVLAIATAVHNSGGIVIVQVERIAERGTLNPREVKIPGVMVDCIVESKPENHWQTFSEPYNPAYASKIRVPTLSMPTLALDSRKIIARRATLELHANSVVNLGIGMPEGVAAVANEEQILELITLTAEPGIIGGFPAAGLSFGAGVNSAAVIDQPAQFDFYDGGGLDMAFLGMAQVDRSGNVNVSKFGSKLAGAGGFINISQNARVAIFTGTFSNGAELVIEDAKLNLVKEGKARKFIQQVEHCTFNGPLSVEKKQKVLYITERCVFELVEQGLQLIEIAPGLDLAKDILAAMDFEPLISPSLQTMDTRIFQPEVMGIRDELLFLPMEKRLSYNAEKNIFFVNFEGLSVDSLEDIQHIHDALQSRLEAIGQKVDGIVNYDNFEITRDMIEPFVEMVEAIVPQYYRKVTRYTTSSFLRMKLEDSLEHRRLAPHIFESETKARSFLEK